MILGIGSDLVDVRRIHKALSRFSEKFENRIFTPYEQMLARQRNNRYLHYGKRFAAKEACVKALGSGIGSGVFWRDIEVLNDARGKPMLRLAPHVQTYLKKLLPFEAQFQLDLSLSDEYPYAQAFVIISYMETKHE